MTAINDVSTPIAGSGFARAEHRPRLSLVIVGSSATERNLHASLSQVVRACAQAGVELVIVASSRRAALLRMLAPSSFVRFVSAPADASPHDLRHAGMVHASGDIVSIVEDTGELTAVVAAVRRLASRSGVAWNI